MFFILALVLALNLLGATALLSAVLGSAGVIGLAVGFAVRDTIENYVASIMLSLRQPFRPNDHVVINNNEGHVIRLTSRATILMRLDGNHLRIPNSEVFPEPIYRLRFDPSAAGQPNLPVGADIEPERVSAAPARPVTLKPSGRGASLDVTPDRHIDEKVEQERRATSEEDLLSDAAPAE